MGRENGARGRSDEAQPWREPRTVGATRSRKDRDAGLPPGAPTRKAAVLTPGLEPPWGPFETPGLQTWM